MKISGSSESRESTDTKRTRHVIRVLSVLFMRDCSFVAKKMSLVTSDGFARPEALRSVQFCFQERPLYTQTQPETQHYHYAQVCI